MDITTIATTLLNSTNLAAATNLSAMSTLAPQTIPITMSAITSSPFLVTSLSHKTLHSLGKGSFNPKHHIKDFSPVTLSTEWSSMGRLLVLACLSVIGSIGNVFMISSVMIEDHLKKAGKRHHFQIQLFNFFHASISVFFINRQNFLRHRICNTYYFYTSKQIQY